MNSFDSNFEVNPVVNQTTTQDGSTMTNFKGVGLPDGGDTHFSFVEGQGFHLTTRLPGGLSSHDEVFDSGINLDGF